MVTIWRTLLSGVLVASSSILGLAPAFAADELVFCYEDADVRPWRTEKGEGLNFALLDGVAVHAKIRFRYVARPWKRCLLELRNNLVDGALGASWKADRLEYGAFPGDTSPDAKRALYLERYVVVRRIGSTVDWNGKAFTGLEGPVGTQLGYSVAENLKALNVGIDDGARGARELLGKLSQGRIAAAVILGGEAALLLTENQKYRNELEILPKPLVEKPYYLMLSHTLAKTRPELTENVWNNIAKVRSTAAYQAQEKSALQTLK